MENSSCPQISNKKYSNKTFYADSILKSQMLKHDLATFQKIAETFFDLIIKVYDTLYDVEKANPADFDALVGENACHIRALYIVMLLDVNREEKYESFTKIKTSAIRLINTIKYSQGDEGLEFSEFLDINGLDIEVPEYVLFAVISFVLCKAKKEKEEKIDEKYLIKNFWYDENSKKPFPYSKKSKTNLYHLQVKLSEMSSSFIEKLSKKNIIQHLTLKDNEKKTGPLFLVMDVVFKSLLEFNCNILVKLNVKIDGNVVEKVSYLYKPNENKSRFVYTEDHNRKICVFVIEGICNGKHRRDYHRKILEMDLIEVIMSGMSAHPQYSGTKKTNSIDFESLQIIQADNDYIRNISEFFYKSLNLSYEIGTNIEKPELFCIHHIYAEYYQC